MDLPCAYDDHQPPRLALPQWEFISPEKANTLKSEPSGNRPVKASVVKEYRRLMESNLWRLSPHGISIGPDGKCSDGNHRMHALAEAGITGVWFLVARWGAPAVELRVDRGTTRSLADFAGVNSRVGAILSVIGSILSIGGSNRRDPAEMQPILAAFGDATRALVEASPSVVRVRSQSSVTVAFITVIVQGVRPPDYFHAVHRSLMANDSGRPPALISLARQLETQRLDKSEITARTFMALKCPDATTVRCTDVAGELAEMRTILRAKVGAPSA